MIIDMWEAKFQLSGITETRSGNSIQQPFTAEKKKLKTVNFLSGKVAN